MPPQQPTRRAPQLKGRHRRWHQPTETLPRVPLVLMAATGFITYLTETLPVGVMQNMRADPGLGLSEGMIGQLVTIYAIGCGVAAIPTTLATRHLPRRALLLTVLGAFVVANAGTGLATAFWVMAVCRAAAGVCAGLLWAMLAGYATRMVVPGIQGKAMALAMAGTPMALSFGTPLGALLGDLVGWRLSFLLASVLAAVAGVLGVKLLPKVPGEVLEPGERRRGVLEVVMLPGLLAVIAVTGIYSVGHNAAYTFVPSVAAASQVTIPVGTLLLVFGVAAAGGLYLVGRAVDTHLRVLTIGVCALLGAALGVVGLVRAMPVLAVPAMALWGLAFGGAPTLFQTASARICGSSQEVGQALIVTTYNCSAAVAAAIGGLLVDGGAPLAVPWFGVLCAVVSTALVVMTALAFPAAGGAEVPAQRHREPMSFADRLAGLREGSFAERLAGVRGSSGSFAERLASLRGSSGSFADRLEGLREGPFAGRMASLRESAGPWTDRLESLRERPMPFADRLQRVQQAPGPADRHARPRQTTVPSPLRAASPLRATGPRRAALTAAPPPLVSTRRQAAAASRARAVRAR